MPSLDRALFEQNPDALIATDAQGRILEWNPGASQVFGFPQGEALGASIADLTVPPDLQDEHARLVREVAAGKPVRVETLRRRRDGSLIHVDVLVRRLDGALANAVLWAQRDITGPKILREARQLEARFLDLLESTPDGMLILDATGHILLANANAEELFGYARGELRTQPVELLLPARFRGKHVAHRTSYFRQPRVRSMGAGLQLFGLRRDGREFPVEISLSPLETEAGRVVMSAVRDITERLRAAGQFRGLLEAAPDAMVIVDPAGRIALANSQTDAVFGYRREELVGQQVEILLPTRFRDLHAAHRDGFFAQPRVRSMGAGLELYARRKDGTEFPVEISLSPLETEEGTLVSAAIRDITERKRVERQLLEQNLELARANQAKSQFLASMSHELRTPLNAIIGFTGTLLMKLPGPLNDEQEKQLGTVQQAGRHLLALINDLLDLTRIEAGSKKLDLEATCCVDVARLAVEEVRPLAEARRLTLALECGADGHSVLTDRRALLQILLNLLGNAVKYTESGGIRLRIESAASDRGPELRFHVIDTGVGVRLEDQDRLFRAFSQLDRPGRSVEGAGLGLYLSARLADLLGGRIDLASTPGVGSTFTLVLPAD